jgi:hypothetical protein
MPDAVHDFLDTYDSSVRDLALELRTFARRLLPEAQEDLQTGWRSIGYSYDGRLNTSICSIIPHSAHVNVQFPHGSEMEDPAGRLEGTGKRGRHAKIRTSGDIDEHLAALVEQAAAMVRP